MLRSFSKATLGVTLLVLPFSLLQAQANSEIYESTKREVLSALPKVEGWCSKEKAETLFDLVLKEECKTCVEIGVFGGSSVLPIASALKLNQKGILYAIDPWDNGECLVGQDKPNVDWWSKVNLRKVYNSFIGVLKKHELSKYVTVLKMTSESARDRVPQEIDFLHIDGNHGEDPVTFDVNNYFPRVKLGGIIVCDDYKWEVFGKPSTKNAYDSMMNSCEIIAQVDDGNCIFLKRVR